MRGQGDQVVKELAELKDILLGAEGESSPIVRVVDFFSRRVMPAGGSGGLSSAGVGIEMEVCGSWGSYSRLITAILHERLGRPVLFLAAHISEADHAQDDLETFCGKGVELFPASERQEAELEPTSEIACERFRLCRWLAEGKQNGILVASVNALMQPVPSPHFLDEQSLSIAESQEYEGGPEGIVKWLVDHQYGRVDQVDVVGEFAQRGGIVDILGPGQDHPVRLEFFGDQVESLRYFDRDTQRSTAPIRRIQIASCRGTATGEESSMLFDYLAKDTLLVVEESSEVAEVGRIFLERMNHPLGMYPVEAVLKKAAGWDRLYINKFASVAGRNSLRLDGQSIQQYERRGVEALDELWDQCGTSRVFLFCENPAEQQRTKELLGDLKGKTKTGGSEPGFSGRFYFPVGFVHEGFSLPKTDLLVVSHHELFGQHPVRRRLRKLKNVQAIDSFVDLEKNDLVVHVTHGIGRFLGMKTLTKGGRQEEYLALEYADKAVVHVPASKIDLVHKYVGCRSGRMVLSRVGGKSWEKQKQKVREAVEDVASELLEIQAQRQSMPGIRFPDDTAWQKEFEESFLYQETDDQLTANQDIKKDMQMSRPMDRLLCGDVGYGKTELAMRAVFKAAETGKQTAVLVPTTVLAEQHYRTFTERLADYPFAVESISRFKTGRQAREILDRTARGQVDVLIGTHRILSGDVRFKDLGLVIIDEEQRFGVEHKERLKRMRTTVDMLTMTATPIPRTLHMALLGLRDISSLMTPPLDRRSIVTEVCAYDKERIRESILRELAREGQVYFLHNRVHNIVSVADQLHQLVPEARIAVGHGQMAKHELEKQMLEFVNHRADVLVCTTIIESGLDIPSANTIIICDADRFGLAELHQLRGRVGRYKNRAYAYMMLPARRTITPTASKRLKAIEEYSQLGSGFRIAMRDLEIRGAGNILGIEQSGHIDAVGYEMYCQLLARAVRHKKGQEEPLELMTHLELNISSHIPRSYIASERQRMDAYRRLAVARTKAELEQLEQDLFDQFGKPPRSVLDLLQLAEIRILAGPWSIRSIVQQEPDLIFTLDHEPVETVSAKPGTKESREGNLINRLFSGTAGSVRIVDYQTVHVRLAEKYFATPANLLSLLRKMLDKKKRV